MATAASSAQQSPYHTLRYARDSTRLVRGLDLPLADGHLQATGHDARGRKQYLYHEHWRAISNAAKFWRLKTCPKFLPKLRRASLATSAPADRRERRFGGSGPLFDHTSIRVGNEEYVRENDSYGLATLRNRHVQISGGKAVLRFRAKAGLRREAEVTDKRLVRLLKQLKNCTGAHVFQYRDDAGQIHAADSAAVNAYLQECTGQHFTAKDFRTWKASALAAGVFYDERALDKPAARRRL